MREKLRSGESLPEGVIERYENEHLGISTFGKPLNARLLFSTPNRAEELYPGTSELRLQLLTRLAYEANRYGVTDIFVPRVDKFNASLTIPDQFVNTEPEILDHGITLHRSDDESVFHDGVLLRSGAAALIITGDCPTIVAYTAEKTDPIIASHAGRNSLHTINHHHRTGSQSVVDEIIQQFKDPQSLNLRIVAGIGKDNFTHPLDHETYGEHNKRLIAYFAQFGAADINDQTGRIDLIQAIRGQAINNGVSPANISWDEIDTTTDQRFWSNRRDGKPRNGVLVCARS